MRRVLFLGLLFGLILSACGPAAAPTIDPAQVQATAAAQAGTMIAQTQAAMPTDTPIQPTATATDTPVPSPTLETLATPEANSTAGAAGSSAGTPGADPCSGPLVANAAGPLTTIKIDNATKAPITVSLYLSETKFGECGYRSYSLGPLDSVYLTDLPQGCYSAFALINDPKKPSKAFTGQAMCPNNDDKWTFVVQTDVIKFYSP